ncbi:MAG: RdgB/HAM1 family non-canonical purine NTP pyrophosphatase [Ruminiclostridium sp.]|nr:RdgB/HAM1 family non-canonical purine NTP pyrophosphatase [Ruminiclostridium sp.]
MKRLIIATKNTGKIVEIKDILKEFPVEVISMVDAGYDLEINENGSSFSENAFLKANALYKISGEMVLADDSGLEVNFLNGAPGVFTSRFAGFNASQEEKNIKIINLLKDVDEQFRTARFVCSISFISKEVSFITQGFIEGMIADKPMGSTGFGYDPIFYLPQYKKTFAQLPESIKNKISHRASAINKFKEKFATI